MGQGFTSAPIRLSDVFLDFDPFDPPLAPATDLDTLQVALPGSK